MLNWAQAGGCSLTSRKVTVQRSGIKDNWRKHRYKTSIFYIYGRKAFPKKESSYKDSPECLNDLNYLLLLLLFCSFFFFYRCVLLFRFLLLWLFPVAMILFPVAMILFPVTMILFPVAMVSCCYGCFKRRIIAVSYTWQCTRETQLNSAGFCKGIFISVYKAIVKCTEDPTLVAPVFLCVCVRVSGCACACKMNVWWCVCVMMMCVCVRTHVTLRECV